MTNIINRIYSFIPNRSGNIGFAPFLMLTFVLAMPATGSAGEVDVVEVTISHTKDRQFLINATLKHEDTGWDHYANKWIVVDEAGNVLGVRVLAHPHVNEQPFTRSLRVEIPVEVETVTIIAFDSVHEDGGATFSVDVPG